MKITVILIFLILLNYYSKVSAQDKEIMYNIETPDCIAHDTVVQLIAEKSAQFQDGGLEAFNRFVCSFISYPIVAIQRQYQGTSYIKFVVNWDGQVKDISVYKSSGYKMLDKEAMRVVKLSPAWIPAKNGDVCVPQQFILPVKFQSLGVIGGN